MQSLYARPHASEMAEALEHIAKRPITPDSGYAVAQEMRRTAQAALDDGKNKPATCNHWPGQKRCGVCGMDCKCGKCQLVPRHVLDEQIIERDGMVKALMNIAAMDPKDIRADDLGRAARIARAALQSVSAGKP